MPSCVLNGSCKPATKSTSKKKSTAKKSTKKKPSSRSDKTKSKICTGRCGACCFKTNDCKTKKVIPSNRPAQRKKAACSDGRCADFSSDSSHSSDCSCSDCYSASDSESSSDDSDGGCYRGRNKGGCCK